MDRSPAAPPSAASSAALQCEGVTADEGRDCYDDHPNPYESSCQEEDANPGGANNGQPNRPDAQSHRDPAPPVIHDPGPSEPPETPAST